jgi:hypothetical protein
MRPRISEGITGAIGHTPLIWLGRLGAGLPGRVAVKHEGFNPFGSIKDRIGLAMIDEAMARGDLRRRLQRVGGVRRSSRRRTRGEPGAADRGDSPRGASQAGFHDHR